MVPATARGDRPIPAKAGIGLRFQHHQAVLETRPDVAWMEVHTENYMGGGSPIRYLDAIRRDFPISLHGVGLSLGSAEGLDPAHLDRVRQVAERIEPALMSEHIAWSVSGGNYLADLLPLPMTEEALAVVCRNVDQMQSALGRTNSCREPLDLHAIPPLDDSGMGVHGRRRRAHRLRHPLRHQQHLCQRQEPRLGRLRPMSRTCRRLPSAKSISPATACANLPTAAPCGSTITARA